MNWFGKGKRSKPIEMGPGGNESGIVPVGQGNVEAQISELKNLVSELRQANQGGGERGGGAGDYQTVAGIDVPTVQKVDPGYDRGDLDVRRSILPTMELSVILNKLTGGFLPPTLYGVCVAFVAHHGLRFAWWVSRGKVWHEATLSWVLVMAAVVVVCGVPLIVVGLQRWEIWQSKSVQSKPASKMWMLLGTMLGSAGLLLGFAMTMRALMG